MTGLSLDPCWGWRVLSPSGWGHFLLPLMEVRLSEEIKITRIAWALSCLLNCLLIKGPFLDSLGWVTSLSSVLLYSLYIPSIAPKSPCYKYLTLSYFCSNMIEVLGSKDPCSCLCVHRSTSISNTSLEHSSLHRKLR